MTSPPRVPAAAPSNVPLIVTRDETLLDELLRLCAAAGVVPEVATDARAALRAWTPSPLVLLGTDLADEVARLGPRRRTAVHLVSSGPVANELFRTAVTVGVENVVELPRSESWLIEALADLEETVRGVVVGVIGGSGGAGASTLACALGQMGAREAPTIVIDADPLGPGLDRLLGYDHLDGIRWDALLQTTGRLSARSLRDAVPRRKGLGLLTWTPGAAASLQTFAVREALSSARRGHELVVVDLPRRLDPGVDEVVSRCDHVLLVVDPSVLGIASALRVSARLGPDRPVSLVVRGPGVDAEEVGRLLRRSVTAELPDQRRLAEAMDLGLGPVRTPRGPLGRAARDCLAVVHAGPMRASA